ncbi:Late embryogenesis abundant protein group 6 [Euphorbia peplus]|nr:Late embryogenesis abundant protein group 6 [Euphorbia peplus]
MENEREENKKKDNSLEGLPLEDSPYVQYKDLEDYKSKGYGTEGHLPPKTGRGGGATDAPTLSGGSVARDADVPTVDAIVSRAIPEKSVDK